MAPTLMDGDHIMVGKRGASASAGGLVVYEIPGQPGTLHVKRIVGVAGDTVTVDTDGLLVNGAPVRVGTWSTPCERVTDACIMIREQLGGVEYVVRAGSPTYERGEWLVPAGHVFVVGDNRNQSLDSRTVGPVPLEAIVGKPTFVWWSASGDGVRWARFFEAVR